MTGDKKALGTKWGIAFGGKWVWKLKDYIDTGFMKLFDPNYLFKDYEKEGFKYPIENNELFDDEKKAENEKYEQIKNDTLKMTPE